ncbi:retrovirus-related pol polyprotein from transposon TNT 1-94 [Tanacetum coccineum]
MCHILGIKPQFENIIKNGTFILMTAGQRKPEGQWTGDERKDFQDSPDDKEDTRSSHDYLNDLEEEYQERALLAKSKRFFKKGTQRFSSAKATDQTECYKCGKKGHFTRDCWLKASVPSYQSPFQPKPLSSSQHKPELRPTKDFEAKYNKVKAKLALLSSSPSASKAATIKNKGLIYEAYEWDKEEVSSDDNEMVEHVNTEILKENKNLRTKLKELTTITETWLNSSNKVNQCISEQILSQKKRIVGVNQLTKDPSSFGQKDTVFIKSSADDTKVSIPAVKRPWLSKVEGFILPNHDTGRILLHPLPPLKKLDGAKPNSVPKTIKSILRSKSTFKAETLKGVKINEPSSAPAKGNKSSSASKVNSAPAGKLKSVKIKDDPPLAIIMRLIVCFTWMTFGGNTRDFDSFREETDEITDLNQILEEVLLTERGDGIASIKRRRRDLFSDGVWNLETASGRGRLK